MYLKLLSSIRFLKNLRTSTKKLTYDNFDSYCQLGCSIDVSFITIYRLFLIRRGHPLYIWQTSMCDVCNAKWLGMNDL